MTGLLISRSWLDRYGDRLAAAGATLGLDFDFVLAPEEPAARLTPDECARVQLAFFTRELNPDLARAFFSAIHGSPRLQWLHVYNTGVDSPVYPRLLERGIRISTSSGTTAAPVALTAITGLLMLARRFPGWMRGQRDHAWHKIPLDSVPPDLPGQTMLVFGLGPIGQEIARLGKALGLRVIGVRRSPASGAEPVDELVHPAALSEVLPRADWLVAAAPLTPETRGIFSAEALALLPPGACVVNIARGELFDEVALVAGLAEGRLGGAYLDVFNSEPLPQDSPLWDLPNVIVTPHDSSASAGNEDRVAELFLANLARWVRGEPLANEILPASITPGAGG